MVSVYSRGIKKASVDRKLRSVSPAIKKVDMIGAKGGGKFKHLYKTKRWQKLRDEILLRDMYCCQICGATGAAAGTLVCDHVRGHPADETETMFWAGPFQTLCFNCHNTIRAKEDRDARKNAGVFLRCL